MRPNWQKPKALTEISPKDKKRKEFQAFLGIFNYFSIFPPSTTDICESLRKLTSARTEWTWNPTYQKILDKAKSIIKEYAHMKFYYKTKPLHIEMNASGLGAALLQTRSGTSCPKDEAPDNSILRPIAFMSKSLSSMEKTYSNIKREALCILSVSVITALWERWV